MCLFKSSENMYLFSMWEVLKKNYISFVLTQPAKRLKNLKGVVKPMSVSMISWLVKIHTIFYTCLNRLWCYRADFSP